MNAFVTICLVLGLADPLQAMTPDKRYDLKKHYTRIELIEDQSEKSKLASKEDRIAGQIRIY